jgi:hypothetical protein
MLLDGSTSHEVTGWVSQRRSAQSEWKRVDEHLRALAQQYVTLEAQLARWLREAERVKVWKHRGCVSLAEYLERIFGFSPRQARDRVLVARRLGDLPALESALRAGELPYTAVRELSRVVVPSTEAAWVEHARGKCLREIEDAISQRVPGDLPTDPPRPDAAPMRISFEVKPETYALFRQVWKQLEGECGRSLEGDALVSAILNAAAAPPESEARKGRAKFQISITRCDSCNRGVQLGGGRKFAIGLAALERAECDAQIIGSLDGDPEVATQEVPPRVRRFVMNRDGGRCQVPGCRSALFLEVHHIVHREHGGTHDPSNLLVLCGGHHDLHHEGHITIGGRAPDRVTFHSGSRWEASGRVTIGEDSVIPLMSTTSGPDDPRGSCEHGRHDLAGSETSREPA